MSIERTTSVFHNANPSHKEPDTLANNPVASEDSLKCEKKKLCRVNKGYKLEDSRKLLGILTAAPSNTNSSDRPFDSPDKRASTELSKPESYRSSGVVNVAKTVGEIDDEQFVYIIVAPVKGQYVVPERIDNSNFSEVGSSEDEHYERNKENDVTVSLSGRSGSATELPSRQLSRRVVFSDDVTVHSLLADNESNFSDSCVNVNTTDSGELDNDFDRHQAPSEKLIEGEISYSECSDDSVSESNSQYLQTNAYGTLDEKLTPSSPLSSNSRVSKPLRQIIPTHLAERSKKLANALKRTSLTASVAAAVTNLNKTGDIMRTATRAQPKLHRLSRSSQASGRISSSTLEHKLVVGAGPDGQMLQLFVSLDARRFRPDDIIIRICASGYNIRVISTDVVDCRRCSLDCGDGIRYSQTINETFVLPVPIDATYAIANLSPQGCLLIHAPMIMRGYRTTGGTAQLPTNCNGNGNVRIAQEKKLEFIL